MHKISKKITWRGIEKRFELAGGSSYRDSTVYKLLICEIKVVNQSNL